MLEITLIGCGGTMPLPGRALAALAVKYRGRVTLVDCGEGTQAAARAGSRSRRRKTGSSKAARQVCPNCNILSICIASGFGIHGMNILNTLL